MELEEGSLVLCKVKKIEKTTIFLEIEGNGEGSLVLSEVVAGRIRNLRDYITINKKIVCKVLNIEKNHIQLSLRRVTAKEREEVLNRHKQERNLENMLKTITNNPSLIINKIKQEHDILDFLDEIKENPKILQKFLQKQEAEKLLKIISEKTDKEKFLKKEFKLSSNTPSGITDIKEILKINDINTKIRYLGSSTFSIRTQAKNIKEADKKLQSILEEIEKKAKQKHAHFIIKEK